MPRRTRRRAAFFVSVLAGDSLPETLTLLQQIEATKGNATVNLVLYGPSSPAAQIPLTRNGWHRSTGQLPQAIEAAEAQGDSVFVFLRTGLDLADNFFTKAGEAARPQRVRLSRDGTCFVTGKAGLRSSVEVGVTILVTPPASAPTPKLVRQAPKPTPKPKLVRQPAPQPAPTPPGRLASFMVATHRRPELLRTTLQSLQVQQIPEGWAFEILVAGRANDPGRPFAEATGATYVPVEHDWVTVKLNALIPHVRGELCLLADDDDIQDPERLLAAVEAHQEGAGFSATGVKWVYHVKEDRLTRWSGVNHAHLVGTTVSVRIELLRRVGGWPLISKGKDGPFADRLRKIGAVFHNLSSRLTNTVVRQHGQNIWKRRPLPNPGAHASKGRFQITGHKTLHDHLDDLPLSTQNILLHPEGDAPLGPTIAVAVTTYSRPESCLRLLKDIARSVGPCRVRLAVFDDCSPGNYKSVRRFLRQQGWEWVEAPHNHGKKRWWQIVNRVFNWWAVEPTDYYYFIQDDIRLCKDFFGRTLRLWGEIQDPAKVSLYLLRDEARNQTGIQCWTLFRSRVVGPVEKTQWVDCNAFLCNELFLHHLGGQLTPISLRRWSRNPAISSGVGRQISIRLNQSGATLYRVLSSYVLHLEEVSLMNPEDRKKNALRAVDFVDGPEEEFRIMAESARITVSLATIPSRRHTLRNVVVRLLPQVDKLNVYLNETPEVAGGDGYPDLPDFLKNPKIEAVWSRDTEFGDQGDAGKFFWASDVQGWHVVCDDDVLYPPNFVASLIAGAERYGKKAAVGFHGATLVVPFQSYYKSRRVHHFALTVPKDVPVHILASNSLCYHSSTIQVHRDDFQYPNMGDIWFGLLAQQQHIPLICLKHSANWMVDDPSTRADSIYTHSKKKTKSQKNTADVQTSVVIENKPWHVRNAHGQVTATFGSTAEAGTTCSLCGFHGAMASYRGRPNAQCPKCGALARHQRQATWLKELSGPVLHVAPNPSLAGRLRRLGEYTSLDMRPEVGTDVVGDLRSLTFESDKFGLVVVSHVLEHIVEVDAAISEVFRVLEPGGHALLDVPYFDRPATRSIPPDHQGHVWEPGKDWADRYRAVGFEVINEHPSGLVLCRKNERETLEPLETPWPSRKPRVQPFDHGWLTEGTERMLRRHLRPEMKVIVELGVWLGKSTQFFIDQCPEATVYAVDLWDIAHLTQWAKGKHPHLLPAARKPLKTFMVNLWEHRKRIVPVQMDSLTAVHRLKAAGVKPDLIYLDTSHLYPETLHEIQVIKEAFPEVPLVGDDWLWCDRNREQAVKRSADEYVAANPNWDIEVDENGWSLVPDHKSLLDWYGKKLAVFLGREPANWAITVKQAQAMTRVLDEQGCRTLVELGAGYSSLVFRRWAARVGARVYSVDTDRQWLDWVAELLTEQNLPTSDMLTLDELRTNYSPDMADAVFIDHGTDNQHDTRIRDLPWASEMAKPGGILLIDDWRTVATPQKSTRYARRANAALKKLGWRVKVLEDSKGDDTGKGIGLASRSKLP